MHGRVFWEYSLRFRLRRNAATHERHVLCGQSRYITRLTAAWWEDVYYL